MKIIPLSQKHETAWRQLWQGYLTFYKTPLPEATTALTFQKLCKQDDGMRGYVLVDETEEPVGFVHTLYHANTWSPHPKCYLEDLFVLPKLRGKSLGRKLIEHVYTKAKENGCGQVYWNTNEGNATARRLYDRTAELGDWVRYHKNL